MDQYQLEAAQDNLRPFRQFVGMLGGAVAGWENATAATDGVVYTVPGQYQTIGRGGVAVEGSAVTVAPVRGGGVYVSPAAVLLAVIGAVLFFKK